MLVLTDAAELRIVDEVDRRVRVVDAGTWRSVLPAADVDIGSLNVINRRV